MYPAGDVEPKWRRPAKNSPVHSRCSSTNSVADGQLLPEEEEEEDEDEEDSVEAPSLSLLDLESVPYNVGANDTFPYGCQFCEKAYNEPSHLKAHEQVC